MKRGRSAQVAGVALFLLLLVRGAAFAAGVRQGLTACAAAVIPALFPFSAAASLAASGDPPPWLLRWLRRPAALLRQPPAALPLVLLALLGGYPVGASALGCAVAAGSLTPQQAQRLQPVCVNAGIGFTVQVVGAGLLGSRTLGWMLFAAVTLPLLLLLPLTAFPPLPETPPLRLPAPPEVRIVESVGHAAVAMVRVCGLVALFFGLSAATEPLPLPPTVRAIAGAALEITGGCVQGCGILSLPLLAAACGFGGLCVHAQVFALASAAKPKLLPFYLFRLLHAAGAGGCMALLLRLLPQAVTTAALRGAQVALRADSVPAAVSLLFLSAIIIGGLETGRKVW